MNGHDLYVQSIGSESYGYLLVGCGGCTATVKHDSGFITAEDLAYYQSVHRDTVGIRELAPEETLYYTEYCVDDQQIWTDVASAPNQFLISAVEGSQNPAERLVVSELTLKHRWTHRPKRFIREGTSP